MVVALGAAGGKRVAEPEAVFLGDAVGDVGKGCRALVRGDHQVGIVAVLAHHLFGWLDLVRHQVVGDVEQSSDEGLVAGNPFRLDRFAVAAGKLLGHEAAFGSHRHDHGVLHHLRLDQPQHLGAEILAPIRPAQTAAGHRPAA